jgi:hypothetical protein
MELSRWRPSRNTSALDHAGRAAVSVVQEVVRRAHGVADALVGRRSSAVSPAAIALLLGATAAAATVQLTRRTTLASAKRNAPDAPDVRSQDPVEALVAQAGDRPVPRSDIFAAFR